MPERVEALSRPSWNQARHWRLDADGGAPRTSDVGTPPRQDSAIMAKSAESRTAFATRTMGEVQACLGTMAKSGWLPTHDESRLESATLRLAETT